MSTNDLKTILIGVFTSLIIVAMFLNYTWVIVFGVVMILGFL